MDTIEELLPLYEPHLTDAQMLSAESVARRCARGVRGCTTDEQYKELIERVVEALAFAGGHIRRRA